MKIKNRDYTIQEIIEKAPRYLVNNVFYYFHDRWVEKQLLRVMQGKADERETHIRIEYLIRTLRRAYRNIPYWRKFTFLKDINANNVVDCLHRLPLMDKDLIRREGYNMCISENMSKYGKGSTGGTTGKPLIFYYGRPAESPHQKAMYEYMTGLQYKNNFDKYGAIVTFSGTRPNVEQVAKQEYWSDINEGIYGTINFCTLYMQEKNLLLYIKELNKVRPKIIRGYSNAILNMAHGIERYGKLTFKPIGIYVTSEYCSLESMLYISKVFGCNVYGQYGQNEACLFAWTEPNMDRYYCSPYYGYVEVLDCDGKQVNEGEVGEVVVTAFGNDVMPFIRYKTGDVVRYGGIKNGVVKLENLIGRNNDYLIDKAENKVFLSGIVDIHYFKCRDKIIQYQLQQDIKGEAIFRAICRESWSEDDENEIRNIFYSIGIDVEFEYVDFISLTSRGKEKRILQNIM